MTGRHAIALFLFLCLTAACASTADKNAADKKRRFSTFYDDKLDQGLSLEAFKQDGPFAYRQLQDFTIRISPGEQLNTDLFLSSHADKAPLLIFQHGNMGGKAYHMEQARRAASWGFHALVVEQVNQKRWVRNGQNLERLVFLLNQWPDLLDQAFDKIILVGHSFGGSAIAIAAGMAAPVAGLIFLDPALYNSSINTYLERVRAPAVILGADRRVFTSRHRSQFFARIPRRVTEVSIRDTTHNDAQYPNQFEWAQWLGFAQAPQEEKQDIFAAAIVMSALGFSREDVAPVVWNTLRAAVASGDMFQARRK